MRNEVQIQINKVRETLQEEHQNELESRAYETETTIQELNDQIMELQKNSSVTKRLEKSGQADQAKIRDFEA